MAVSDALQSLDSSMVFKNYRMPCEKSIQHQQTNTVQYIDLNDLGQLNLNRNRFAPMNLDYQLCLLQNLKRKQAARLPINLSY